MAKPVLGVDIGYDSLKLVLMKGTQVKKSAQIPMPKNLIREGRVVSPETMGELIRGTMKEYGLRCNQAAIALPNETVYMRSVTMPRMSDEQLRYNLPFEFRDYITDELKNYVYDYAMISTPEELAATEEGEDGVGQGMELFAVAAPASLISESRDILRKAGLKMVKATPTICTYQTLIRMKETQADGRKGKKTKQKKEKQPRAERPKKEKEKKEKKARTPKNQSVEDTVNAINAELARSGQLGAPAIAEVPAAEAQAQAAPPAPVPEAEKEREFEYCILDMGYHAIRMYMFRGDRHIVTRVLEIGMSSLDQVISEANNVDLHVAHTWLLTNYEDCQNQEACRNAYENISVELMRAMNFYRFSNPDSQLDDIFICGGGARIRALSESIAETVGMHIHTAEELIPDGEKVENGNAYIEAIGAALS